MSMGAQRQQVSYLRGGKGAWGTRLGDRMLNAQQRENMQDRVWDPRDARRVCTPPPGRHLRSSCPSALQDHTRSAPSLLALLKASASLQTGPPSALACFVAMATRQLPVGQGLFGRPISDSILDLLWAATPPPLTLPLPPLSLSQMTSTQRGSGKPLGKTLFQMLPRLGKLEFFFSVVFLGLG